jgi:archaellum biogenesis ATPase FlaH
MQDITFNDNYLSEANQFLDALAKEIKGSGNPDVDEQLKRIEHLKAYHGDDRIISFADHEAEMANMPEQPKLTLSEDFQFRSLSQALDGFELGELIVVSAQQKTGKSLFVMQLADGMREEAPCCFLFEMPPKKMIRQLKKNGVPVPQAWAPRDNKSNSLKWMFERMMESMVKHGSRVFIIDNFDWLEKNSSRGETNEQACGYILHEIKNFCLKWNVVIILVAHTTQMPKEQPPNSNNIKGTSAFKQIADIVIMLWRKTEAVDFSSGEKKKGSEGSVIHRRTNETLLTIAENRRGGEESFIDLVFTNGKLVEGTLDTMRNLDKENEVNKKMMSGMFDEDN